ncbi:hypothetical protein [Fredinandcohnia sp. 179-A 10B2 NHS]|uniref:hypothetical protein n=1 Tax=Fredinandcohnia sp. 179-A 10B2 NHS TaxID=3235176 RepID=UPI0039A1207A
MTVSVDSDTFFNRSEAFECIQGSLQADGKEVKPSIIHKELDKIKSYYQNRKNDFYRIPAFEVECIYLRLRYLQRK